MPRAKKTGPTALTASAANIMQGAGGDALMRDRIKHIHVVNKTANGATFDLYLGATGATAAGTELFKSKLVAGSDTYDWYGDLPLESTEYLVGLASALTTLVITVEFEREVV
jgi:hypothetical protein